MSEVIDGANPTIHYRSRPFMCGAVGDWSRPVLTELVAQAPTRVRKLVEQPGVALFGSSKAVSWRSSEHRGLSWGALADGTAPRRWHDAAETWMAAGVEIGHAEAAVHTDALGMQDIYYRHIGDAVYFAGRMEPLLGIVPGRVHINWDAWASTLALTAPVGTDTPFEEIGRIPAAGAWTWRNGFLQLSSFEPSWMNEGLDRELSPAEVVDVLAQAVQPTRRTVITLSGGWDSRMLGLLARRRRRRMQAWTTSTDDGGDRDVEYAAPVAAALGIRQQTLIPGDRAWVEEHASVRLRTGFQTVHHTWLMPLVRKLHGIGAPVLDGLAGDALFKTSFIPNSLFEETRPDRRMQLLWEGLEATHTA